MIVGCPKEIKPQEGRVGLLPADVAELVRFKHTVLIQKNAGLAAGATDEQYRAVGAQIIEHAEEIFARSDLIVKVKEPLPTEFVHIRSGQVVFTYFHFASSRQLTEAMLQCEAVCIAYEGVEDSAGRLPLLEPMSEVAGHMAVHEGMHFLSAHNGGKGVLLGGVPGVSHGKVVIIGGGVVGLSAAKTAAGIGASVVVLDKNLTRLRCIDDILPRNCTTRFSTEATLLEELPTADLVVGAVLLPGRRTPKVLLREHLKKMKSGSVIVDVAVDHGGCCETSRPTSHENPTYTIDGILHYGVTNMPGAVPVTATAALTNATLPYVLHLANSGWRDACMQSKPLHRGLAIAQGKVLHRGIAETFHLSLYSFDDLTAGQCVPVIDA